MTWVWMTKYSDIIPRYLMLLNRTFLTSTNPDPDSIHIISHPQFVMYNNRNIFEKMSHPAFAINGLACAKQTESNNATTVPIYKSY